MKDFDEYKVADISNEDVEALCKLEKAISEKTNEDIVLIAYKSKDNKELS